MSAASASEPEDARERLLTVAIDEFAEKGFAGARVDEIARKARANKQLLYYYFGNKVGLYTEVLGRMVEESRHKILYRPELDTLADKFRWMAGTSTWPNSVRWQRLFAWEALEQSADGILQEDERREVWRRRVADVEDAQAAGEIDPELDADLLALALVSVVISPYVLPQLTKLITGVAPTEPGFGERYERLIGSLIEHLGRPD